MSTFECVTSFLYDPTREKLTGNTFLYGVRDGSGSGVRAWKTRISNVSTVLPDRAAG